MHTAPGDTRPRRRSRKVVTWQLFTCAVPQAAPSGTNPGSGLLGPL